MIDFDALVLAPCMSVFGQRVVVTPTVSQPNAPAFVAQGVFAQRPTRWETAEGNFVTTMETTLGIRLADFYLPPKQGDSVLIGGADISGSLGPGTLQIVPNLTTIGGTNWFVWDINADGQGGASLTIKLQRPTAE